MRLKARLLAGDVVRVATARETEVLFGTGGQRRELARVGGARVRPRRDSALVPAGLPVAALLSNLIHFAGPCRPCPCPQEPPSPNRGSGVPCTSV